MDHSSFNPLHEGVDLSRRTLRHFYSPQHRQFCSPHDEQGTIDAQHGYTVWPVAIAFWMAADCAKRTRAEEDMSALHTAYDALERHWNAEYHAYCAWLFFPGNTDIYYDDNAHCANALVTAYEATGSRHLLHRAAEILRHLIPRGWDRSDEPGGIAWHVDQPDSRNACSTLSVAMAACRLALHEEAERDFCTELARSCLDFSARHLFDADGLVADAIKRDGGDGGAWRTEAIRWTYNTGFAIEALLLFARLTGDGGYHERADRMAAVAIDRAGGLFDAAAGGCTAMRHWWDSGFFAQHLVEALAQVARARPPGSELAHRISAYLAEFAAYCRACLRDPADGLYYRNLRLYAIDQPRTDHFNRLTGAGKALEADKDERAGGDGDVASRPLIKTLLGNAGMARIFLFVSDLHPEIRP